MAGAMKRSIWTLLAVLAVGVSVLLSATNLFLGDLNQDEGWYLYAARLVSEGHFVYRDFMFTQGPAMPVVYGAFFPMIGKLGVAGGRLITSLFGLAAAGCAAWLAARSVSRHWKFAALAAFILTGVNVYQSYFTTILKTYALCAFFLTFGFVLLSYANSRRGAFFAFWSGFFLALAACTRLSAGIALPVTGIWLICNYKKVYPFAWVAFGLGGGLMLLAGLGTCFALAPENTHFALLGYHAGRSPGGLMELAALKAGFASRFVQAYFIFSAGVVLAFFLRKHHRHVRAVEGMDWDVRPRLTELLQQANQQESPFGHSLISLLWLTGALITLVHFAAPFPYDDYQAIAMPLLGAALAATLAPRCPDKVLPQMAGALLLVAVAASFSSPINQSWMVRGRDRIWWNFKETPDLMALQRAGAQIRDAMGNEDLLLTQDTYLAIEAGARVPHGLEMGPFSYYPEMPRSQARKLNLLNKEMLLEILEEAKAPVAAFSGYGLSMQAPSIGKLSPEHQAELRAALDAAYEKTSEIPNFGQAHTTLEVFRRKGE